MSRIARNIVSCAWRYPALVMSALATSFVVLLPFGSGHAAAVTLPQTAVVQRSVMPLPLAFEPLPRRNTTRSTEFVARGSSYVVRINPAGAIFNTRDLDSDTVAGYTDVSAIVMRLLEANAAATGRGETLLERRSRYYIGDNPADWRPDVPNYSRVGYHEVYPGVDVVYYGAEGRMEFDFMVTPGADPGRIRLTFSGTTGLHLDADGDLVLYSAHGKLRLNKPVAYQTRDVPKTGGKSAVRMAVSAAFELLDPATVGFTLGDYDPARPLVIDPVILFSSYLGGSGNDAGLALAVDNNGNRYVAGSTISQDFPPGGHSLPGGLGDAFVTKLAPDGTPLYTTILGSFGTDTAVAIAIDNAGKAYITGDTDSGSLPPVGSPLQPFYGGAQDAFVARLDIDGTLEYISYLGGSDLDTALAITLDGAGNIYIGGSTLSDDFPPMTDPPADPLNPVCALQCTRAQQQPGNPVQGDGFIVKISADLGSYVYASYLGGNEAENVWAVAVDTDGQAYLGGTTSSFNFPLPPGGTPLQAFYGGGATDGYVVKLNAQGDAMLYGTYLGGGGFDRVLGLAIDVDGNAYVTGATNSNSSAQQAPPFPLKFSLVPAYGGGTFDAFVSKLNPGGDDLIYSTYLGGKAGDEGRAITLNDQNEAIVVGTTDSADFPLQQPLQLQPLGDNDAFIAQIAEGKNQAGDIDSLSLVFASYLGGTGTDSANAVAVRGTLIDVVGASDSPDFPSVSPTQDSNAGGLDAFILSLDIDPAIVVDLAVTVTASPIPVPQNGTLIYDVLVSNLGQIDATGVILLNSISNALLSSTTGADCDISASGVTAVCHVGDISAGAFSSLEIKASPLDIAQAVNSATLIRANQTDSDALNNSDSLGTTVVDNSGEKVGAAWALFIIAFLGLALRRLARVK